MPSNVDKLKILGKMYHLSLLVCGYVEKFNRAYKFTLGDRLVTASDRAEELILLANRETDPGRAAELVHDMLTQLDLVDLKTRKAMALGLLTPKQKGLLDMHSADIRGDARKWRSYFLRRCGRSAGRDGRQAESRDDVD